MARGGCEVGCTVCCCGPALTGLAEDAVWRRLPSLVRMVMKVMKMIGVAQGRTVSSVGVLAAAAWWCCCVETEGFAWPLGLQL